MKKTLLVRLIILFVATMTISGCVIVPFPFWWDDGEHHGGGYRGDGYHYGDWYEGHRGYGGRY